jgi:hypothetical protein
MLYSFNPGPPSSPFTIYFQSLKFLNLFFPPSFLSEFCLPIFLFRLSQSEISVSFGGTSFEFRLKLFMQVSVEGSWDELFSGHLLT